VYILLIFSLKESDASLQSQFSVSETVGETETNEQNSEVGSDDTTLSKSLVPSLLLYRCFINEAIYNTGEIPILLCNSPGSEPGVTPITAVTTLSSTLQNEKKENKATTTDVQSRLERRMSYYSSARIRIFIFLDPSEWNTNEVLGWFQSYKFDEYINRKKTTKNEYFHKKFHVLLDNTIGYSVRSKLKMV
jgi:hypothetical protein